MKKNVFQSFSLQLYHALVVGVFLFSASIVNAEVPKSGGVYQGGTLIEYPGNGVTFVLPAGVIGVASEALPDHEMTVGVMPYAKAGDNSLYIQVGNGDYETMAQELNQIVTFNGTQLHPVKQATKLDGGVVFNTFKYIENGAEGSSFMLVLVADDGTSLIFTSATPPEKFNVYKDTIFEIAKTVKVTLSSSGTPNTPQQPTNRPAGSTANAVVGAWMSRSNRSSGGIYIESANKWVFSADGTVAWGSGAVIAGGTAGVSLRGGGDNPPDFGAWATNGETLRINWNDGSQGQWTWSVFDYYGTSVLSLVTTNGETYNYKKID